VVELGNIKNVLEHFCRDLGDVDVYIRDSSVSHNMDYIELSTLGSDHKSMMAGRHEFIANLELVIIPKQPIENVEVKLSIDLSNQPF